MTKLNIDLPPPTGNLDFDKWVIQTTQYLRDHLGVENWIAPTLINSWANYVGGAGYCPAGYCKDGSGFVHIRGAVSSGAAGNNIFVLPSGYRPSYREVFASVTYTSPTGVYSVAQVDVLADGSVLPVSTSNVYTTLSGITFYAG